MNEQKGPLLPRIIVDGQAENGEILPYAGRDVAVIGGSDGTGLAAAIMFRKLGAKVAVGTRSESHYKRSLVNFRRAGADTENVVPLIADITDPTMLEEGISKLQQEGFATTDVILAAAGGMPFAQDLVNHYFVPMNRALVQDPENAQRFITEKTEALHRQLDIWLPQYHDAAVAINYTAPINTPAVFQRHFTQGFSFVYWNSTFGDEGVGPRFYGDVLTKELFKNWLEDHAHDLAGRRIDPAEIVAPIIEDTAVGTTFLERVAPLVSSDLRETLVRTKVRRSDVVDATKQFLDMSPQERAAEQRPYKRYVWGDNGVINVTRELPAMLRVDPAQFPF